MGWARAAASSVLDAGQGAVPLLLQAATAAPWAGCCGLTHDRSCCGRSSCCWPGVSARWRREGGDGASWEVAGRGAGQLLAANKGPVWDASAV